MSPSTSCTDFDILEALPPELLPRILLHLDTFSLRALFRACASIARQAVVITEWGRPHAEPPCTFFHGCEGLRKVPVAEYHPAIHKALFKIYKTAAGGLPLGNPQLGMSVHERFPYIDKRDSFVLIMEWKNLAMCSPKPSLHLSERFLQQQSLKAALIEQGCAFEFSSFLGISERYKDRWDRYKERWDHLTYEVSSILKNPVVPDELFYDILFLTLDGIERIESLTLPRYTFTVTVIFSRSFQNPLIRDLTFAPYSSSGSSVLEIYYHDVVPLIERVCMTVSKRRCTEQYSRYGNAISLVHVPSMAGHLTEALQPHPDEGRDFTYLTEALRWQAGYITITGGPNGILGALQPGFDCLLGLNVKQTCRLLSPDASLTTIENAHELRTFRFHTLLERPVIPALSFGDINKLEMLCITSHRGIDLSRCLLPMAKPAVCLGYLSIHVTSRGSDHVSSVEQLSTMLAQMPDELKGLAILGLKKSPRVSVEQLKRRVPQGVEAYQAAEVSLIG